MKRRTSIILCLLLGSFFISSGAFSADRNILINEIGAYESNDHEWIELWNKGPTPVDLTGWKFWENNTNHSLTVSSTDFILGPGSYGVIVQDTAQFILDYPFFTGKIFDSSWSSLSESGEEIGLKDRTGNFIEQFTYISAPDFSLQRMDPYLADYTAANWAQHAASNTVGFVNNFSVISVTTNTTSTASTTPTPPLPAGQAGPQGGDTTSTIETATTTPATTTASTPTSTPTSTPQQTVSEQNNNSSGSSPQTFQTTIQNLAPLKINELVADPGDGNEWVELYNTSLNTIDITGAMICDNRNTTSTCKKLTGSVNGHSWLQIDLQTKSFLNNSGDSVILKDATGLVIDRIDYEDDLVPDEGQSLARKIDGVDTDSDSDWVITDIVTPGAVNTLSINVENNTTPIAATSTTSNTTNTNTSKTTAKTIFVWQVTAPSSADINELVTISVDGTADPRGSSLSFLWTLEDGKQIVGPEIKTSFTAAGSHVVSVQIKSTSGYSEEKKIEITVGAGLSSQADIIISEVLPNPDGEDSAEFIELKNNAAAAVNLTGWILRVGEKNYVLPENTIIAANGFLTFYKAATKISLVNTAGKVELLSKDKIQIDTVKYEKPPSGKSYTLVNGEWRWIDPSPGRDVVLAVAEADGEVLGEKIVNNEDAKTATAKSAGPLVISIAEARVAAKGQPAKLQGIVTVVPDIFGSQFFYITGDGAGIEIYQSKKDFPPVGVGDLVEVTGTVSESSGIKRINVKNSEAIDILSLDNAFEPVLLNLDEINEDNAGALVQVEGEITEIKSTFMYVDDGAGEIKVYFKKNAKIDKKAFKEGQKVKVIGVLEKTSAEWQVWPRGMDDIEPVVEVTGEVLGEKIVEPTVAADQPKTMNKYLIATGIGLAGLLLAFLARSRISKFFKKD